MAENTPADQLRIKYGFWVVIVGLVVIVLVLVLAMTRWTAASDVTAVVGSVMGVVGTVVGAFFGIQVGSTGKEKAEADKAKAENELYAVNRKATMLAGALQPEIATKILNLNL